MRRDWDGRQGKTPRPDFEATRSKNDREVVEIALGEDFLLCRNMATDAPAHMDKVSERPYRAFLQVPVRTEKRSFGFLSVDSDVPYTLTDADVGYVILMARVLASGLALASEPSLRLGNDGTASIPQQGGEQGVQTQ